MNDPDRVERLGDADLTLAALAKQLEGSTHGGPRHTMIYDTIKTRVELAPEKALDHLDTMPTSARSAILMAVSALGRRALPTILCRLANQSVQHRRDAAMVLCIWSRRGFLSGNDRPDIEQAIAAETDEQTKRILRSSLDSLRT